MRTFLLFLTLSVSALCAEDFAMPAGRAATAPRPGVALWKASVLAVAAADAMDLHSSWGKHELNPTLSNPSGTFGIHGALIKLGLKGSLMGVEYLVTRGHPSGRLYRAFAVVNFGVAGATAAVAGHNYTIARP